MFLASLFCRKSGTGSYAKQFREDPDSAPSRQHWLGPMISAATAFRACCTAPGFAADGASGGFVSCGVAGLLGGAAGYLGGWTERGLMAAADLVLSLPWCSCSLAVRACFL